MRRRESILNQTISNKNTVRVLDFLIEKGYSLKSVKQIQTEPIDITRNIREVIRRIGIRPESILPPSSENLLKGYTEIYYGEISFRGEEYSGEELIALEPWEIKAFHTHHYCWDQNTQSKMLPFFVRIRPKCELDYYSNSKSHLWIEDVPRIILQKGKEEKVRRKLKFNPRWQDAEFAEQELEHLLYWLRKEIRIKPDNPREKIFPTNFK